MFSFSHSLVQETVRLFKKEAWTTLVPEDVRGMLFNSLLNFCNIRLARHDEINAFQYRPKYYPRSEVVTQQVCLHCYD
jgi:hypothetical protein